MSTDLETYMESKGLPESDREEIRNFHKLLALRAEWQKTGTEEARRKYLKAIEQASK